MNTERFPYSEIERKIGYTFRNRALLQEAFTHSTYANRHGGKDNERLEYLGDTVLQLAVTEWQFFAHKDAREGLLTRERQTLVCEEALLEAVEALDVKRYLLTEGKAENIGKKTISSLFETLTAAVYLDGGYEAAKTFIYTYVGLKARTEQKNPKSVLQEYLQSLGEELPKYVCEKSGKDNAPTFVCEATARDVTARGAGGSKKAAEQNAAEALREMLLRQDDALAKKEKNKRI